MSLVTDTLTATITVQSVTGATTGGDPTWGDKRPIPARVEPKVRRVLNAEGQVVTTSHRIFTDDAVLSTDRVWLPGTDTTDAGASKGVAQVDDEVDLDGVTDHYEVLL